MFSAGKSVDLSPFDLRLVRVVRELQDEVRGLVSSVIIAEKLAMKPRTARYYLRRVEDAGLIFRPVGQKRGYSAIKGVSISMAVRNSIETVAATLDAIDVTLLRILAANEAPMISSAFVALVGVSGSTIKRRLQLMEEAELIHRPDGERSGYAICGNRTMRICAYAEARRWLGQLQPFHSRILNEMRWRERYCDTMLSRLLAEYLEIPDRSMRYYLKQLEGMRLVHRPMGNKGGYRLTDVGIALLDMGVGNNATLN